MEQLLELLHFEQTGIVLKAPSFTVARDMMRTHLYILAGWAQRFGVEEIKISFPEDSGRPFEVPAIFATKETKTMSSENLILPQHPGLYLGEIGVYTINLLNTLTDLLSRKDADLGLVRVRDNLQIALTQGASLSLGTEDIGNCVQLKRSDYWHPSDLADFNRHWQQQLREDGSNHIEYTYRALRNPTLSRSEWGQYTTRYRLIQDANELYHCAETLEVKPIAVSVG